MKKYMLPLWALLGGAAAFILRMLQNQTGFEAVTGLPVTGCIPAIILPLLLLVLAVLFLFFARRLPETSQPAFPQDFLCSDHRLFFLVIAGIFLIGAAGLADLYEGLTQNNLLIQMQTAADPYAVISAESSVFSPRIQCFLGVLSLLTAAALFSNAAACREARHTAQAGFHYALLLPHVALVSRLVLTYRLDSVNPVLQAYYLELLALIFLTLGFYRFSSFAFGCGRTRRFAFYSSCAIVLCIASLADGGPHVSSILLYAGGALTLLGFLLLHFSPAPEK